MTEFDHSAGDCVELFHVQAKGGKVRVVYKHVIAEGSRFFRYEAADEVFNEPDGSSRITSLDVAPSILDVYLGWLQSGKLAFQASGTSQSGGEASVI